MAEGNLPLQQVQGYTITKKLGSGGYGTVYLGVKEDLGKQYQTAIKHISMPNAEGYESVLQDYNYDKTATEAHFEKLVAGITSEINTLLDLSKKDNRYIVAYYDHDIQKSVDPLRFEIFMRMEYLTPLNRHIRQKGATIGEVLKLGLNMCDALALCHNNGVMHRDIKEANIFVSETGNYKLGDFGVAKVAIETTQAGSIKGTASYMAPEIYLREPYDMSVDIYSLGIVLYKLLNNQRLPFMPDAPASFTADDKNSAESRRLKGETPPPPANAKNRLGEIVVKACSGKAQRYATAEELKKGLSEYIATLTEEEYDTVIIPQAADGDEPSNSFAENSVNSYTQTQGATMTMGAQSGGFVQTPTEQQNPYANDKKSKKEKGEKPKSKKKVAVLASVVGILLLAGAIAIYVLVSRANDPVNQYESAIQSGDFEAAAQLYRDELRFGDGDKLSEAESFTITYAESIRDAYIHGEIEYDDALAQLQETGKLGIISSDELAPLIAEINEMRTSRAAYEAAQKDAEAGDYKSAIGEYRKVITADSNYSDAQTQLATAIGNYKEQVMEEVSYLESDKLYEEAISMIRAALIVVPDDADFLTKISDFEQEIANEIELIVDGIVRSARGKISSSADYEGALSELRSGISSYPNNETLKTTLSEIESAYIDIVLNDAAALAANSEYESAVAALNAALRLVPNNASLKSAVAEYEAKYPKLLQQLTYFTGSELSNGGQDQDNLQGTQTNIITGTFNNTYKLNGEYTKITGIIYQPFSSRSSDYARTFEIYGDGKLLYSIEMKGGIEPINFSIDLTGVKDLQVKLTNNSSWNSGAARLADVLLYQ